MEGSWIQQPELFLHKPLHIFLESVLAALPCDRTLVLGPNQSLMRLMLSVLSSAWTKRFIPENSFFLIRYFALVVEKIACFKAPLAVSFLHCFRKVSDVVRRFRLHKSMTTCADLNWAGSTGIILAAGTIDFPSTSVDNKILFLTLPPDRCRRARWTVCAGGLWHYQSYISSSVRFSCCSNDWVRGIHVPSSPAGIFRVVPCQWVGDIA